MKRRLTAPAMGKVFITGLLALLAWASAQANQVTVLEKAIESKAIRIAKVLSAQKTIEAQYFSIEGDQLSEGALALMRTAAIRGVNVRIIVDSMHNLMSQKMMSALMYDLPAHAKGNIEIREFNQFNLFKPLCYTRRMHDKALIIDGQTLIVGDRNVANGYYDMVANDENGMPMPIYQGVDVMIEGGEAVAQARKYFEERWNSRDVKPVRFVQYSGESRSYNYCAFVTLKGEGLDINQCLDNQKLEFTQVSEQTLRLDAAIARIKGQEFQSTLTDAIRSLRSQGFRSDKVEFLHDSVTDKKLCKGKSEQNNIGTRLYKAILENTQERLLIVTPYLVVTPKMEQLIKDLKAKNPKMLIRFLTNSLESNDVGSAHAGYLATKKMLTDLGVKIYEFRHYDRKTNVIETLHAKMVLMDSKKAFIGSYNWDYRSENLNSEVGVIVNLEGTEQAKATQEIRDRLADLINKSVGSDTNGDGVSGTGGDLLANISAQEVSLIGQVIKQRQDSAKFWGKLLKLPIIGNLLLEQL